MFELLAMFFQHSKYAKQVWWWYRLGIVWAQRIFSKKSKSSWRCQNSVQFLFETARAIEIVRAMCLRSNEDKEWETYVLDCKFGSPLQLTPSATSSTPQDKYLLVFLSVDLDIFREPSTHLGAQLIVYFQTYGSNMPDQWCIVKKPWLCKYWRRYKDIKYLFTAISLRTHLAISQAHAEMESRIIHNLTDWQRHPW